MDIIQISGLQAMSTYVRLKIAVLGLDDILDFSN